MSLNFKNLLANAQNLKMFQKPLQSLQTLESSPRLYHYTRENEFEKSRIHLRLDPDGTGTIVVNANRVMHLNPTAAFMAWLTLEGKSTSECVSALTAKYSVNRKQAETDLSEFNLQLDELLRPDGACPIHELDLDTTMPFSARPSAPYRMDLALTYRCNNDCAHCYNARERNFPELTTDQWKRVIDELWALGVPHIVFTGGEATLRNDLPELIHHAESNGQITGLNTNARRLMDMSYVQQLVDSGLDHVQITVESCVPEIHDEMMRARGAFRQTIAGVNNVLKTRLYVMTNTTMLRTNVHTIPATLDFLADVGVPTIGLNALIYSGQGLTVGTGLDESELQPILDIATQKTAAHGQKLIWYTPTQYCKFDPTASNLGVKGCTASLYSMCIESNGNVLPCQSYYNPLGNFLTDSWGSIWNHKLSVQLRERQNLPFKCETCPVVAVCGGGCPLQFEGHRKEFGVDLPVLH
ncbi:MAG TPA: PqqD family peptide modification chaperone [Anaerolineales bacterium]|nr:PqqD family peptide modification chaperone [Anaerolineales bacterium]